MINISRIVYSKYYYDCGEFDGDIQFDIYFEFENIVAFNNQNKILTQDKYSDDDSLEKHNEIIIITKYELEENEPILEANRYCRKNLLIVEGIITFFIGIPLSVLFCDKIDTKCSPIFYEKHNFHLSIENKDYTSDLIKLLERVGNEPEQVISLLDRWRKAVLLKYESSESDLYNEEAILSFFLIFELLGESLNDELKNKLTNKLTNNIKQILKNYYEELYLSNFQVEQMVNEKIKLIKSILIGDYLPLRIKIEFFLKKYDMLDPITSNFIKNIIKTRNTVAHGRIDNIINSKGKFIWPLSPFFNLVRDSYNIVELLYYMTAIMISKFLGLNRWIDIWKDIKACFPPSIELIKDFYDNKLDNGIEMLLTGNQYNITWRTIFQIYISHFNSIELNKMEKKLKIHFIKTLVNEENSMDILNISVLFADSQDNEIKNKAIENIKTIAVNRWCDWSDFRDIYQYLDFYNVNIKWFKQCYYQIKQFYIQKSDGKDGNIDFPGPSS